MDKSLKPGVFALPLLLLCAGQAFSAVMTAGVSDSSVYCLPHEDDEQRCDVVFTGTQLEVWIYAGGRTVYANIDGAVSTVTSPGVSDWTWVTVATGLSDSPHFVMAHTNYFDLNPGMSVFRATGASPVFSAPAHYGTVYRVGGAMRDYTRFDGSPVWINGRVQWYGGDSGMRFTAAASTISLWTWVYDGVPDKVVVYQDGIQISEVVQPLVGASGQVWDLLQVAAGLDGQVHTYEIFSTMSQAWSEAFIVSAVVIEGSLINTLPPLRPTCVWYGDSIAAGNCGASPDSRTGEAFLTSRALGCGAFRKGYSGARVSTYLRDQTIDAWGVTPQPTLVLMEAGVNDITYHIDIPTFQADEQAMVANMAAGLPAGSKMVVRGILPTGADPLAPVYRAAQEAAVAAYNATSPAIPALYIDPSTWAVPGCAGVHPSAEGFAEIARRQIPLIAAFIAEQQPTTKKMSLAVLW